MGADLTGFIHVGPTVLEPKYDLVRWDEFATTLRAALEERADDGKVNLDDIDDILTSHFLRRFVGRDTPPNALCLDDVTGGSVRMAAEQLFTAWARIWNGKDRGGRHLMDRVQGETRIVVVADMSWGDPPKGSNEWDLCEELDEVPGLAGLVCGMDMGEDRLLHVLLNAMLQTSLVAERTRTEAQEDRCPHSMFFTGAGACQTNVRGNGSP